MRRILCIVLLLMAAWNVKAGDEKQRSPEAQCLLNYLHEIYGTKMLSGVTACVNWNISEAQWVHQHTGKWPAINQFDFIHHVYSKKGGWIDYSNPSVAINWAKDGGIVAAMWHWGMKTNDGTTWTCTPGDEPGQTSFHPSCVRDPKSAGYRQLVKDIDIICGYLKPLKKAGIPVLWRPFHEAQGNWSEEYPGVDWHKAWFWWGIDGPEVLVDLWRFLYDRMVNYHGLDNLIWVFNFGSSYRWYPGDEYVDIIGQDIYNLETSKLSSFRTEFMNNKKLYGDKPLAMPEVGNIPLLTRIWTQGAKYLYFCTWYDYERTNNVNSEAFKSEEHNCMSKSQWEMNIARDFVLTREDLPDFRNPSSVAPIPSTPLGKPGIYTLSGQKVQSVTRPGVYIVDGKKKVLH